MTVFVVIEREPDHSEYPYLVRGVYSTAELATQAVASLKKEFQGDAKIEGWKESDTRDGYCTGYEDGSEMKVWWEVDECNLDDIS